MLPIYQSLQFWTLLIGVVGFIARFYFPDFPLDNVGILALVLFVLGLIGVTPTLRANGIRSTQTVEFYNQLAFWQLVAGLVFFVLRYVAPDLPIDDSVVLGLILFILGLFGIVPELRARHLIL